MISFDTSFNFGLSFYVSLAIIIMLAVFFIILGVKFSKLDPEKDEVPLKGIMMIAVLLVGFVNDNVDTNLGKDKRNTYSPFFLGLITYLFFANITSMIGLNPPTSNLAIALSMTVIAFLIFEFSSFKFNGLKNKLKGMLGPVPFVAPIIFPINFIGEFTTPFSMGMRLFGNIFSGVLLSGVLFGALEALGNAIELLVGTAAVTLIFHPIFDFAFGLIQVYVFFMLTTMNIKINIE